MSELISEELKINLIKHTIKTEQGWKNLAEAIGNSAERKQITIDLFNKIFKNQNLLMIATSTLENYLQKYLNNK